MDKHAMMEKLFREAHEKDLFTGTWLFAEKGEIVSKGAMGWSDPDDTVPVREDMIFDLASVSKNFTATAIMLLRREGLLSLDDEITKFFPEIPYKGVTIRNLLNHTGGLPDYMEWIAETATKENTIPDNSVIVRFLCECGKDPLFAPGEKWEYSNTGYCLLAQIVTEVSGVKFEEFLKKNILEPAGMTSSGIIHRRMNKGTVDNLAYGMVLDLETEEYVLPDVSKDQNIVVPLDGMVGDGLIHSNIFDLLKWDRALREELVLTREEQQMMYTPGLLNSGEKAVAGVETDAPYYGFGWEIGEYPELGLIVCHSGSWPGYGLWFERFMDADKVLIILRCRDMKDGWAFRNFFEGIRSIAKGEEPGPITSIEDLAVRDPDRSGWESFCGKYEKTGDDALYIEEVFMKNGDLYLRAIADLRGSYELKLYPLGENVFGIKRYAFPIEFGDGCIKYLGESCKKL